MRAARAPLDATFANPYAYYVYGRDAEYRAALSRFDAVAADGIGVVVAKRLLGQRPYYRVSFDGTSLAPMFMAMAERRGLRIALVGGAAQVAEKAAGHFLSSHPDLRIVLVADGYDVQEPRLSITRTVGAANESSHMEALQCRPTSTAFLMR